MKRMGTFLAAMAAAAGVFAMGVDYNGEAGMRAVASGEPSSHPLALGILAIGVVLYFVPTIVAAARRKVLDFPRIFLLNAGLGWTVIGWAVAMAWSISDKVTPDVRTHDDPAH